MGLWVRSWRATVRSTEAASVNHRGHASQHTPIASAPPIRQRRNTQCVQNYSTFSVAFIVGWKAQKYANSPFFAAVYCHDFPGPISCESKPPAVEVTVCGNGSLLTHTTESPAFTVSDAG